MPNSQTLKSAARCRSVKNPLETVIIQKFKIITTDQMLCVCFEFCWHLMDQDVYVEFEISTDFNGFSMQRHLT